VAGLVIKFNLRTQRFSPDGVLWTVNARILLVHSSAVRETDITEIVYDSDVNRIISLDSDGTTNVNFSAYRSTSVETCSSSRGTPNTFKNSCFFFLSKRFKADTGTFLILEVSVFLFFEMSDQADRSD